MKKLFTLALTLILIANLSLTAFAATATPPIEPLWDNTQSITSWFSFNGSSSKAIAEIVGKEDTSRIEATIKVYILVNNDWVYLGESSASANSRILSVSVDFSAESGKNYKSIVVVHVTNNAGVTESLQRAKIGLN